MEARWSQEGSTTSSDDFNVMEHNPGFQLRRSQLSLRKCPSSLSCRPMQVERPSACRKPESAEQLLHLLAPGSSSDIILKLNEEGISTAADLACLDKQDLHSLGLSMLECARVMTWARQNPQPLEAEARQRHSDGESSRSEEPCGFAHFWPTEEDSTLLQVGRQTSLPSGKEAPMVNRGASKQWSVIMEESDFWCSTVAMLIQEKTVPSKICSDVREDMLEELYDVTPERVAEVYGYVASESASSGNGRCGGLVLEAELGKGLRRFGLGNCDEAVLTKVFEALEIDRSVGLSLGEFVAILSRLKLAQLFLGGSPSTKILSMSSPYGPPWPRCNSNSSVASSYSPLRLVAVDFNSHRQSRVDVYECKLREFVFKNRLHKLPYPEAPLVRWVHMPEFHMKTLLTLTVKYSLHPLGVEDVIEQCPSKMDRYGSHYFVALEALSLAAHPHPDMPVKVAGFHFSMFCSGPPHFDTIVTVAQPDRSFPGDWPGGAEDPAPERAEEVAMKLRERLMIARSRLRERRADFLMYHAVDLAVDELFAVTRAYAARAARLDADVQAGMVPDIDAKACLRNPSVEAMSAKMQLAVVIRKIRGLHRVVKQLICDSDLPTGLGRYLHDVADHLDEAYEDATALIDKYAAIVDGHRRAVDRLQEDIRQRSADRLNTMLFFLTVGTFVFAPMQFLAGVYGMNFVDREGKPTMPELEWQDGYLYFWIVIVGYLILLFGGSFFLYRRVQRRIARDKALQQALDGLSKMPRGSTPIEV